MAEEETIKKLLSLLIRMKALGPKWDGMPEIVAAPPDQLQQAQEDIWQKKQQ